ncbi:MAG: hypothetical protein AVDCRST_MAG65-2125, partial [uncultured Solirubrobacteraceae bacterium]
EPRQRLLGSNPRARSPVPPRTRILPPEAVGLRRWRAERVRTRASGAPPRGVSRMRRHVRVTRASGDRPRAPGPVLTFAVDGPRLRGAADPHRPWGSGARL